MTNQPTPSCKVCNGTGEVTLNGGCLCGQHTERKDIKVPCFDCSESKDDRCGECNFPLSRTFKGTDKDGNGLWSEWHCKKCGSGHPRQEEGCCLNCSGNAKGHGCVCPTPKSGEMEEINEQPLGHTLLYWLQMIKAVKSKESFAISFPEGVVLSPVAQERELSRQEKELRDEFENGPMEGECICRKCTSDEAYVNGYRAAEKELTARFEGRMAKERTELNERWEAREKRLREAMGDEITLEQVGKVRGGAEAVAYARGHNDTLAAFDQAAALKE